MTEFGQQSYREMTITLAPVRGTWVPVTLMTLTQSFAELTLLVIATSTTMAPTRWTI
jgi:hypothetical protein